MLSTTKLDKDQNISPPPPERLPLARRIKYVLEYIPLRMLVWLLSVLPYKTSLFIGASLGRITGRVIRKRYDIAKKNISGAFPTLSDARIDEIIMGCWENIGAGIVDFAKIQVISKDYFFRQVDITGLENLQKAHKEGRGVVIVTAHYGSWELAAQALPFSGFNAAVIARRVKNPYVNDLVNGIRAKNGNNVILARNGVRESIRWLKSGNVLVILIDHRITDGGMQIPFLGKNAYATSLPAILGIRYNVPVLPAKCVRTAGKLSVSFGEVYDFSGLTQNEGDIYKATLQTNETLEGWIKERPEQWLWIHNRWKT